MPPALQLDTRFQQRILDELKTLLKLNREPATSIDGERLVKISGERLDHDIARAKKNCHGNFVIVIDRDISSPEHQIKAYHEPGRLWVLGGGALIWLPDTPIIRAWLFNFVMTGLIANLE